MSVNRKKFTDPVKNVVKQRNIRSTKGEKYKSLYKSKYPNGKDLSPGSDLHDRILTELLAMVKSSKTKMSTFLSDWEKVEEKMEPYVEVSKAQRIKNKTGSTPVYLPLSYATLQTWLTFMINSFLVKSPVFRYTAITGDVTDAVGAVLLEQLIQAQVMSNSLTLNLYTMFRDAGIYNLGVVVPSWETRYVENSGTLKNIYGNVDRSKVLTYEGNKLTNIHPKNFYPDPNVPINRIRYGDFVAWSEIVSLNQLRHAESEGKVFNVEYLEEFSRNVQDTMHTVINEIAGQTDTANVNTGINSNYQRSTTTLIPVYAKIIPSRWGLSSGKSPEIWVFMIAGEQVIVSATKVTTYYDGFPIVVASPEFDGYNTVSPSKLSMVEGLQTLFNWLFHSHMANVKKVVNDMIIYNPFLINEEDVLNPEAGKVMRLNQVAWGMPNAMENAIKQLHVVDVTQGHMQDLGVLKPWWDAVTGVSGQTMGQMTTTGERRTRFEVESAFTSATNRIEADAYIMQEQAIKPLGKMMALHTQQFMSAQTIMELTKEAEYKLSVEYGLQIPDGKNPLIVDKQAINIPFDIAVNDNYMNKALDMNAWSSLLTTISQNPAVAPNIDMNRLILHMLRQSGAPNAYDFYKKGGNITPQVVPDEQLEQMQQQGNVAPVSEVVE